MMFEDRNRTRWNLLLVISGTLLSSACNTTAPAPDQVDAGETSTADASDTSTPDAGGNGDLVLGETCGDNVCDPGEVCSSCAADCGVCVDPQYYVATTGKDVNGCTQAAPCATIGRATQVASPGSIIHVAPGTYTGNIVTAKSGTATKRLTYISDTRWGAKLVGTGPGILWTANGSYVDIIGFDISGPNRHGIATMLDPAPGFVHFINNRVHDILASGGCNGAGGSGIDTGSGGPGGDWFLGNVIANIAASMIGSCATIQGIYIANANAIVKNNIVSGVAAVGISQWHAATASTIVNNTVFHCKEGILLGDGDGGSLSGGSNNNYVANNLVAYNTTYGIVEGGTMGGTNTYAHNLVFNNSTDLRISHGTPIGTVTADPGFVNYQANGSGDYHLKLGSKAIDMGTSTNAPHRDFDNVVRPQGPAVDIGAYEYGAPTSCTPPTMNHPSTGAMVANQGLNAGQVVSSPDGRFKLGVQTDGNVVLSTSGGAVLWATNKPAQSSYLIMQTDGNLVQYNACRQALWNSGTWTHPGASLAIQNDGNLVIYHSSCTGGVCWASNTGGH